MVPEGTKVRWNIKGKATDNVVLTTKDTTRFFDKSGESFSLGKTIYSPLSYEISTSNAHVDRFENLSYAFKVIPDAYPNIRVAQTRDSLNPNISFFEGQASDDHGIKSIRLVYYPAQQVENAKTLVLHENKGVLLPFYYTFPSGSTLRLAKRMSFTSNLPTMMG